MRGGGPRYGYDWKKACCQFAFGFWSGVTISWLLFLSSLPNLKVQGGAPGGMFANSIRARAHSHGHAHDCRHAHARGYYHGHKKYIIGIAHGYSHGHANFTLAVPMAFSTGKLECLNLKAKFQIPPYRRGMFVINNTTHFMSDPVW